MQQSHGLVVIETHPVQYHAPVYRALQQQFGVPVTAIYGSDFSVAGYHDREFDTNFAWDTDLLTGYRSVFLSRVAEGGARSAEDVRADKVPEVLRQLRPAAVLCVGYSPRFYRQVCWHVWRSRLPLLFRAETTDHAQERGPLKRWLRDRMLRWLYHRCQRLLYVGLRSREHYLRLGCSPQKLVFSPYCVDASVWATEEADRCCLRDATRQAWGVADHAIVVLMSGKLVPRKGPDLLIRAVKLLTAEQRQRYVIIFLGDGAMREDLARLAAASPTVAVRFTGFRKQRELSRFYHGADLLVLASRSGETWGLVVNEALHHGLPCVVSDQVGCAPDLIQPGTTGEVFPANDPEGLRHALERAAALIGPKAVRERCRQQVAGYSVTAAAAGMAAAFDAVCCSAVPL